MRNYAISTLFLVFALVTGACAGRQVRTRSVSAPPIADAALTAAPEPVPALTSAAPPAPIMEAPAPSIDGDKPVSAVAVELGSTDFDVQGSLDRDNAKANAEIALEVRRMTEPATRAPYPTRLDGQLAATLRIDRKRVADQRRSDPGLPAFEDGRQAVVGSLAPAPHAIEQEPGAPPKPSILPAPQGAKADLNAGHAKDREGRAGTTPLPAPDREAVTRTEELQSAYLLGSAFALIVGILCVILFSWLQRRRLKAIAAGAYEHYADGTIIEQKIARGNAVIIRVTPPVPPEPRSEPVAEQKAQMDTIEQTWHAEGDAADREKDDKGGDKTPLPVHERFDHSDAGSEALERTDPQPPPVPIAAPDILVAPDPSSPHVQPASDDAPRLAAGSGKVISSSDDRLSVSGVAHVTDPPQEPRSEPEFQEKVIIYEDDSSNAAAMTAATSTPN